MVEARVRAMSVHVKEHQMVKIFKALHYGVPHHIVVLARKTPEILIIIAIDDHYRNKYYKYHVLMLAMDWGFH